MGYLYFVRHGQTLWNIQNKICGATDVDLTEKGRRQAEELGLEILKQNIHVDQILCSPLKRAVDTASEISRITGIPLKVEDRLVEQSYGKWEGTNKLSEDFLHEKESFICTYDGGETMLHLAQRVYNLLDELKAEKDQKTYMCVSHNGVARAVHSYFYDMTNMEFASYKIPNCKIITYRF